MKRIIKILGIITIVALLLGGGAVAPVAAQPTVTVIIDAPDEAAPDSDFTANVNISDVVDFDACNYDVSFDASVLRLDNVTSGLIGSTTIPVDIYNEISSGTYRVIQNVPGLSGVSGTGYLAVLHFHVIGSAGDSSTISLSNGMLSNNLAEEIAATWTGGTVNVVAPSVPVSINAPDEAAPDSDFTANVNIGEVTNFDACNYDVSFDASVLRLDNVTSGLIDSTTIPVDIYNEISSGTYRVIQNVPGLSGVSGTGYLAVFHFHVIGSAGDSSTISLSNGMLADNLAEEIAATWTGDSVSVSDTTPPSVTITALTPDPTNDNTPTFTGTATDTLSTISSVEYKVDDGSWTAATASDGAFDSLSEGYTFTTPTLADGAHTVYVRATDSATNTTAEANYASDSFTVDTGVPSVTITALTPDPTNDNTPTFTGTATDTLTNISSVEYRVDDGSWTAATASDGAFDSLSEGYTFTTAELADGAHTVYVRATDSATNTTAEANYASDSFTVQTVTPGDGTGDGVVNALDITKVERIITGLDAETSGADANQDGSVNALDITKIERIITGLD